MSTEPRIPSDSHSMQRLEQLERQAQESAANSLAIELTPESLIAAVRKACRHEDREILSIQTSAKEYAARGQMPPIACGKGCWHCCAQIVGATIPEILRIAEVIKTTWTGEERKSLFQRIDAFIASSKPFLTGQSAVAPRDPCPLLREAACSVWDERPFICRGVNSTDVNACIKKREDPLADVNVPQVPAQYFASLYARTGFRKSLKAFGLDAGLYELASGLKIALESDCAAEMYSRGENPFKSIEIPSRPVA